MTAESPDRADSMPGATAIRSALERVYGGQAPKDFTTVHRWALGGPDPLDGVTVYRASSPVPHWHFVTLGFSELYEKVSDDAGVSGWGFEASWRLACATDESEPPSWVVEFLQMLAREVFERSRPFRPGAIVDFGGPISTSLETKPAKSFKSSLE